MALTYTQSGASDTLTWGSTGTASAGAGSYKDVTDSGVASGDLLIALAAGEGYTFSGGTRSIATQTGSTGAWTTYYPTPTINNDTEVVSGWATASGTGSVTVRPVVRTTAGSFGWIGSALIRIPAAEWSGTVTGVAAFQADADGQVSVTLGSGTWTVIYIGADYSATNPGTTNTPTGGANRSTFTDASHYSVAVRTWTGQASGTRSYGPSGLSGDDFTGVVIAVPEAAGGSNTGTLSASLPRLTASISGTATNPGALAASVPTVTASIAGSSTNPGALSASLPRATASITGQSVNPGSLTASVPALTASIAGGSTNPGVLGAAMPVLTAALAGQSTNPGTLAATLPRVTSQIGDQAVNVGTLTASLPRLNATVTGASTNPGTMTASLPRITGAIDGVSRNPGTLAAALPRLVASVADTTTVTGSLVASLPRLTAAIVGVSVNPGVLAASLPRLTASLTGGSTPGPEDSPTLPGNLTLTDATPALTLTLATPALTLTETTVPLTLEAT